MLRAGIIIGAVALFQNVAGAQCMDDSQCRFGRVCRTGQCEARTCSVDTECPDAMVCSSGTCVSVTANQVQVTSPESPATAATPNQVPVVTHPNPGAPATPGRAYGAPAQTAHPSAAPAQQPPSVGFAPASGFAPAAPPRATRLPGFVGTLFVGPAFENVVLGAQVGIGFMAGGTLRFALAARLSAGTVYGSNIGVQLDVDAGLRMVFGSGSVTPHLFALADYGRAWEISSSYDQTYEYDLFQGRFGGGLLFGRGRVRKGFEVGFHVGKRIHANADENPWEEDYGDSPTFSGTLRFVLTL